jgi:hypothetical protein
MVRIQQELTWAATELEPYASDRGCGWRFTITPPLNTKEGAGDVVIYLPGTDRDRAEARRREVIARRAGTTTKEVSHWDAVTSGESAV